MATSNYTVGQSDDNKWTYPNDIKLVTPNKG